MSSILPLSIPVTSHPYENDVPEASRQFWQKASNILCVRLDAIGDVLMTTPAIRALRQDNTQRRITLLTSSAGASIASMIPEIDNILVYSPPWMKATEHFSPKQEFAIIESLREREFDAVVIFNVYTQSPLPAALLCYLAGIPRCLAYCHENPYQLISEWLRDPEPQYEIRHEVRRQLDLVAAVGCFTPDEHLSLQVDISALKDIQAMLIDHGINPASPWVLIHPGASAPSRRYPAEHFSEVTRLLVDHLNCQVVFSGSSAEIPLINEIIRQLSMSCVSLAGKLDMRMLVALVSLAPLLIVNNTGPAHIAAALQTPVVDLYAMTNMQHTPWGTRSKVLFHDVPCRNCYKSVCPQLHHDCLRKVEPIIVLQAAADLLGIQLRKKHQTKATENVTSMKVMPSHSLFNQDFL